MERRKVIRQGKGTLTMSLPMSWVKQVNIRAGSEIFVEQKGLKLVLFPSFSQKVEKKTTIDLRPFGYQMVNPILYNVYVRGDEEIRFLFEDPKIMQVLSSRIHDLLGFEIVEQSPTSCTVKALAQGETENFDMLLRRVFLVIVGIAQDGNEALKAQDLLAIKAVILRERTVNTLVGYCLRVLNRTGGKDVRRSMHLYALLNFLEQLGDSYSRYHHSVSRLSPSILALNETAVLFLRQFYELFFRFEPAKASQLRDDRDNLRALIEQKLVRTRQKDDLQALHFLRTIADLIVDIEKFCLAMQLEESTS